MTEIEPTLTPGEVAKLFNVDPKTVARWAKQGKLPAAHRTLGGHRRFKESEIRDLLKNGYRASKRWDASGEDDITGFGIGAVST